MLRAKVIRTAIFSATCIAAVGFLACSRGDTAGNAESVAKAEGSGDPFVADGGSGSTLTLSVPSSVGVGQRVGFSVTATDPSGQPLAFIKIVCNSERGISILEPTDGANAVQSTSSNGLMSGQIGGTNPGSYLLECRAPEGDRKSVV